MTKDTTEEERRKIVEELLNLPEDNEHCATCNGSGQVAVGSWGVRPPKVKCPDCDGKWTLG